MTDLDRFNIYMLKPIKYTLQPAPNHKWKWIMLLTASERFFLHTDHYRTSISTANKQTKKDDWKCFLSSPCKSNKISSGLLTYDSISLSLHFFLLWSIECDGLPLLLKSLFTKSLCDSNIEQLKGLERLQTIKIHCSLRWTKKKVYPKPFEHDTQRHQSNIRQQTIFFSRSRERALFVSHSEYSMQTLTKQH